MSTSPLKANVMNSWIFTLFEEVAKNSTMTRAIVIAGVFQAWCVAGGIRENKKKMSRHKPWICLILLLLLLEIKMHLVYWVRGIVMRVSVVATRFNSSSSYCSYHGNDPLRCSWLLLLLVGVLVIVIVVVVVSRRFLFSSLLYSFAFVSFY